MADEIDNGSPGASVPNRESPIHQPAHRPGTGPSQLRPGMSIWPGCGLASDVQNYVALDEDDDMNGDDEDDEDVDDEFDDDE